jgi:aspartate carbamoyltransferase catalytic subunit
MQQELGKVDGLTITLLGDLKYGRTVHSLVQLLAHYNNITINYLAPDALAMPQDIVDSLSNKKGKKKRKRTKA